MEAHLIQGSEAWKNIRKQYVTATDAAVILGLSPWKTPYKLWRQKMDLDPPDEETEKMREGSRLEDHARKWFFEAYGILFTPKVVFKDFMMASLDGMTDDDECIIEIKCGQKSFEQAKQGIIPEYYRIQMQHQMYCSGLNEMTYLAFNGEVVITLTVELDREFVYEMIPKLREFYQCLISFTHPTMTMRDYHQRSDPEWNNLVESYRNASQDLKRVEQLEQDLRKELISLAGEQSTMGNGIKLSKVAKKGVIDYTKIPQLKGLNLEEYRKPSSEYWRVILD